MLRVLEDDTATVFTTFSSDVVLDKPWPKPKPHKVDWRVCRLPRQYQVARELAITTCEFIETGNTLELGTVHALMGEIGERVDIPDGVLLIEPTVAVAWARGDQDVPSTEMQEEQQKFDERVARAEHLLIAVHSEGPQHYSFLKVSKKGQEVNIEYRDSLKIPSENAKEAATKILRKLGAIDSTEECPPPSNKMFQVDGWSCGLWVTRWVERALRELSGEGRSRPLSITDACARGNDWIVKIKNASILVQHKDAPEPNTKTKSLKDAPEPKHKSLKDAQKAAKQCKKCVTTSNGSKGCRACMGEFFEQIRQKGFMARAFKG